MAASASAVRAGGAFVELYSKDDRLRQGLAAAERRVAGFASHINRLGGVGLGKLFDAAGGLAKFGVLGTAGAGLAAGLTTAAGAAAVLYKSLSSLQDTARIGEVAEAFGTTVESMSGLLGAMEAAGSGAKESIESITQFSDAINKALEGKGENAAELFDILKVTAAEFKKTDIVTGVYKLFDALRRVEDPLQRTKALALAFGTDGEKLLLPMLNRTSAELQRQAALYAVSAAEVTQAREATAAYTRASAGVERAWRAVASAVAPTVQQLAAGTEAAAHTFAKFIDLHSDGAKAALRQAAAWGELKLTAAGLGPTLETVGKSAGGIADAFRSGDLELAAKTAFKGLEVEWARVMLAMRERAGWMWDKGGGFDQFRRRWLDAMDTVNDAGNAGARQGLKWLTEPLNDVQGWLDKQMGNVEPGAAGGPRKNTRTVIDAQGRFTPPADFWERKGREWASWQDMNAQAAKAAAAELQKLTGDLQKLRTEALAKSITPALMNALFGGSARPSVPAGALNLGAMGIAGGAGGFAALAAAQGAKSDAVDRAVRAAEAAKMKWSSAGAFLGGGPNPFATSDYSEALKAMGAAGASGGKASIPAQQLAEEKKGNSILAEIDKGIKELLRTDGGMRFQ